MKNSIQIFLIVLIALLPLTSCKQNKETDFYSDESKSLDRWLGFYGHYGTSPKEQEGYNGYISIDLVIYQETGAIYLVLIRKASYCSPFEKKGIVS